MHEVLCRAEGPLILIAVEHEAPVRVMAIGHPNEIAALTGWIQARPERRALMRAALDAQTCRALRRGIGSSGSSTTGSWRRTCA